ncbi:MAG: hypothetical protein ACXADU_11080 [Promethearchaeota archaeon]|jgi:hypothetical protein
MSKSKVKGSSGLFNILLFAVGIVFIFKGVLEFLPNVGILPPVGWDPALSAGQWLLSVVMGIWCVISGIGMFKEAEWAMGQALVLLSLMVVVTIGQILSWIINLGTFDYTYWPNYIILVAFSLGAFGIIWLLATHKRYG